jgi:hypothetical protein
MAAKPMIEQELQLTTRAQSVGRRQTWREIGSAVIAALSVIVAIVVLSVVSRLPILAPDALIGGPFWHLPASAWVGIALLAAAVLVLDSDRYRVIAVAAFGLATMGALGYLEPLGVFHDSWRNVGLGQLALSPEYVDSMRQVSYVESSPISFLYMGLLQSVFPDMPSFLRVYPILCVLFYCTGIYVLAVAFADVHGGRLAAMRSRLGLLSVFAFLTMAPLFAVRVNPAPQSLAFLLMPFCLAAILASVSSTRFRIIALVLFCVMILTHAITAAMVVSIAAGWLLLDRRPWRGAGSSSLLQPNSVILYASLFLSWLIYIGLWIISPGSSFVSRLLDVLNNGQHASVTAVPSAALATFIWLHRAALAGSALLILAGLALLAKTSRLAALRLVVWLGAAGLWAPFLLLGDFSDRGPLFASLPAALAVGYALSANKNIYLRRAMLIVAFVAATCSAITAYNNHIGEVVIQPEIDAFSVIEQQSQHQRLSYGYVPPLAGDQLLVYSGNRIHAYTLSAIDNSLDRLISLGNTIIISDQMRAAAAVRGPRALELLEQFEARLLQDSRFELVYDSGSVRAFRAR